MVRFQFLSLIALSATLVVGCGDSKQPPKPVVSEPSRGPAETIEATEVDSQRPVMETIAEPVEPLPAPQRVLLLARGGPLIVDVWLSIDDRPHDEGLEKLLEQVLAAGDTDGDGRSTWAEWSENRQFLEGELVNFESPQPRRLRNWIKRYDENEDGQMQRPEAAAWLGRDSGRSARAFRARSSRAYLALASTTSRLWHILDGNDDGKLTRAELAQASQRLFLLDTNDDQIVDKSELATLRDQLTDATMQRSSLTRPSKRPAAIHLSSRAATSSLEYVLSDLYAPRQQLRIGSFSNRQELFERLDENGDHFLDSGELEQLLDVDPHLKIAIDFSTDIDSGQPVTRLKRIEHAQCFEQVVQPSPQRIVLATDDTRLTISAHDLSSTLTAGQRVRRDQIQLMVHDRGDSLFELLDSSSNGTLGEREISMAADRIAGFDTNGDEQVTVDELSYSMTVAFVRSEPPGEMSYYVPSYAEPLAEVAQAPAWFGHADLNSDGDVSRNEFLSTAEQFAAIDKNNDGFISAQEATSATPQ